MDFLWLMLAVFLFVVCAALLVVEIFVPSFGLLTVCALVCLVGGVSVFFQYGTAIGWVGVGIAAVLIPVIWIIAYRLFPNSSFGRKIILGPPDRSAGDAIPDNAGLQSMLGRAGVVLTPLRPVGMCDFDGERIECVSEAGYVEKDREVKVIHVEGTQLTVRLAEGQDD